MKWLKDPDQKAYEKARDRLSRVSTTMTHQWAQTSLWAVQEGLEHPEDPAALQQARTGVLGLLAAVDTLLDKPR